jgi:hypothetical protein
MLPVSVLFGAIYQMLGPMVAFGAGVALALAHGCDGWLGAGLCVARDPVHDLLNY